MAWSLRYTAHLGYAPPSFQPQFARTCRSVDPRALIGFAASLGMAGILYPWAIDRPDDEVDAVSSALADTGLACSCIIALPPELAMSPIWADAGKAGRDRLEPAIAKAAVLARRLGSSTLAVLLAADAQRSPDAQTEHVARNLRRAARVAADHGVALGVEPMILLPGMLLRTTRETVDLLDQVDHPAAGMIFDSGHVAAMDGDIIAAYRLAARHVRLVQLADAPGRVEPGAGALDLVRLAADVVNDGYRGLIDLEHGWLDETRAGEEAGLARLQAFDREVATAITAANQA